MNIAVLSYLQASKDKSCHHQLFTANFIFILSICKERKYLIKQEGKVINISFTPSYPSLPRARGVLQFKPLALGRGVGVRLILLLQPCRISGTGSSYGLTSPCLPLCFRRTPIHRCPEGIPEHRDLRYYSGHT